MCICCGILETLALCVGVKVVAVCHKKHCQCKREHQIKAEQQNTSKSQTVAIKEEVSPTNG